MCVNCARTGLWGPGVGNHPGLPGLAARVGGRARGADVRVARERQSAPQYSRKIYKTEERMNIVKIGMTFAVALVLILTATGLWAAGAEEEPAARCSRQEVCDRPQHRQGGGGTPVRRDNNLRHSIRT